MKRSALWKAGLRYDWRVNLAVALSASVAVAVLTGALAVGDSMRGSLRDQVEQRLGHIDRAVMAEQFFPGDLAGRLAQGRDTPVALAAPIILAPGSLATADESALAGNVNILGVDGRFWELFPGAPAGRPKDLSIVINQSLADELNVRAGEDVLARLQKPSVVPREAVLGKKTDAVETLRLTVGAVIPDSGVGRFTLRGTQQAPLNAYVDLAELQRRLRRDGQANVILAQDMSDTSGSSDKSDPSGLFKRALQVQMTPEDAGFVFRRNDAEGWLQVESSQMILSPVQGEIIEEAADDIKAPTLRILTYLVNATRANGRSMPYSTYAAVEESEFPFFNAMHEVNGGSLGEPKSNEIVFNAWAAEDLGVNYGDPVTLEYYVSGDLGRLETVTRTLSVRGVAAMEGEAVDPALTPEYPGIADAAHIRDWDPPFPVDLSLIRDKDEQYWDQYRATPKGFLSLDAGQSLWQSRYGRLTAVRLRPKAGQSLDELETQFRERLRRKMSPAKAGFTLLPVREMQLKASKGGTDFGMLFLGLSLFLIIAAAALLRLVFRLGVERRAREIGLLRAVGFSPKAVRRLFWKQGALLAAVGGVFGLLLGAGYAWLMLAGLQTWWIDAIGARFMTLHVTGVSLAAGYGSGLIVALISIWSSLRDLGKVSPVALLAGEIRPDSLKARNRGRLIRRLVVGVLFGLAGLGCVFAARGKSMSEEEAFFSAAAAFLIAALAFAAAWLEAGMPARIRPGGWWARARMGASNAARNPGRSLLIVSLVAVAAFLVTAVGANRQGRISGAEEAPPGTGGFSVYAESDVPLYQDLNTPEGREALALPGNPADLSGSRVFSLRLRPGEDVSCLNLYQPQQPRIIGAPQSLIERGGFEFGATLAGTGAEKANPWLLLNKSYGEDVIPAFGDANTVKYILKSKLGRDLEIQGAGGADWKLRIVGLLKGSMLQSELVISETRFRDAFPGEPGYRVFLVETPKGRAEDVASWLEKDLASHGFDATLSARRLAAFRMVEEAYLSAFQTLGALGLLLGTLGLAAVLLRNIWERKTELALLWALGFSRRQVAGMIMAENLLLLIAGLVIGAGTALAALLPARAGALGALPWASLTASLSAVLAAGLTVTAIAARSSAKAPQVSDLGRE